MTDDVKLLSNFVAIKDEVGKDATQFITTLTELMIALSVGGPSAEAPYETGNLQDSLTSEVVTRGDEIVGTCASMCGYGGFVHEGTQRIEANPWFDRAHAIAERQTAYPT